MNSPLTKSFLLRLFVPFALAYFGSVLLRNVNAVAAPHLVNAFQLNAADLGLLTGLYFIAFTAAQLPLGGLLDKFDSARVNAACIVVAAIGTALFASAQTVLMLSIGRALIGFGVAVCLMSSLRAFALWLPSAQQPLANGLILSMGTLGAIVATVPVEWAIASWGWRSMFAGCAVFLLMAVLVLWFVPPACKSPASNAPAVSMREALRIVWRTPEARRGIPCASFATGALWAVQSLWAGPWLKQMAHLEGKALAEVLICMPIGMLVGNLLHGYVGGRLRAQGKDAFRYNTWMLAAFTLMLIPFVLGMTTLLPLIFFAFGFFGVAGNSHFALLAPYYPAAIVGRANGVLNMAGFASIFLLQWGMGVLVNAYRDAGGGYDAKGFSVAFTVVLVLQVVFLAWLWPLRDASTISKGK